MIEENFLSVYAYQNTEAVGGILNPLAVWSPPLITFGNDYSEDRYTLIPAENRYSESSATYPTRMPPYSWGGGTTGPNQATGTFTPYVMRLQDIENGVKITNVRIEGGITNQGGTYGQSCSVRIIGILRPEYTTGNLKSYMPLSYDIYSTSTDVNDYRIPWETLASSVLRQGGAYVPSTESAIIDLSKYWCIVCMYRYGN